MELITIEIYVYLAITAATFLSYIYSVTHFFRPEKDMLSVNYLLLKCGSLATWGLSLFTIYQLGRDGGAIHEMSLRLGILFMSFILIFFWTTSNFVGKHSLSIAYSKDVPSVHLEGGPYRFVRHPFYTGYILNYYSIAAVTGSYWVLGAALIMHAIYHHAARTEEKKFLQSGLNTSYAQYMKNTGMFFPKLSRLLGK